MSPSRKNKKSSSESGSASASNTDKSNGETANATKKANSSVADVSKKLKTKKAKPEGKNVWQSVLVIAVIISVISISLPIFFPNLLDNCQHHVCKLVGIWCKDSNQIHAKSGLHSEENVQMGIKKEVSHNKKEKTSQGKTNSEHANSDITSPADREIKVDLDKADKLVEQKRPGDAIVLYDKLLARFPSSPRALYGKAWALEMNSELQRSNALLEQSITTYERMLALPSIPRALHIKAVRQCASRMAFRGWSNKAAQLLESVAHQYPEEFVLWNEAGVQWLMTNQNERARFDFKQALKYNPNSGYAKVHLGFILKVSDLNYESAIQLLEEGIASRESGVIDGRFFFQLGDALYRLGRVDRAYEIYRQGAQEGLFKSMWQRSLYDINRLTGRPWWTVKESGVEQRLKVI